MNHTNTNTTFVLLAGGKSVRMGEDKGMIPIHQNSNFLSRSFKKLNVFSKSIFISLREEQTDLYANHIPKTSFILDKDLPIEGPLKGILSSYLYLKENNLSNRFIYFLPIDIPFIKLRTIKRLLDVYRTQTTPIQGIFYKSNSGLEPLCGIYSSALLSVWTKTIFQDKNPEFSLQKRIRNMKPEPIILNLPSNEEHNFRNINSKKDL
ncbi:molybdenum cofactor guanylyltransferase [Leptospira mtsangambouensis]|uniref:Molybdenum cofactor guanylyltransferase n=2 Tax=Leptospira mtsangambouensis TaxID=2484912 RepID=A0ABY2P1C6_9LEPT|nr:molybdenum cofactor guanylyltransferase [Leptospira mtsangambouensis]TGM78179.1 molybdenum cofactor guanylyltransferase [Leptospira mtsangambouensis]